MAKRFIDTCLFDDVWFMNLLPEAKILWLYFITKCDHAGILKLNQTLAKVQTGIKDLTKVIEQLGNRIVTVNDNIFFVPKFLEYQYPGFPECNFKAAKSAIEILRKYDLIDNEGNIKIEFNSYVTVKQELPNSYGISNGISNGNGISIEKREENFLSEVSQFNQYPEKMLSDFCRYWTEKNKSRTKMRFETEKTFEINKRLTTWANRSKDYGTTKTIGADPSDLAELTARKLGIIK